MDTTIVSFRWGSKYGPEYVERLREGLRRNITKPYRFTTLLPHPDDEYLTELPGCFCRLRLFDPEFQAKWKLTGRIVCIDLDVVVTGNLDHLLERPEPFAIVQGINSSNPNPYNGSLWSFEAGYRPDVWSDFSLEDARKLPAFDFADDQQWMLHKLPGAGAYTAKEDKVFGFKKPGWGPGDALPNDARLVAFPGWRDPSKFQSLPWVQEHWRV